MTNKRPVLFLLLLLTVVLPSRAYPGEILVTHGKFAHFNIVIPDKVSAGTEVQIRLEAVDSFSETIANLGGFKRSFKIHVTGAATITPASFNSTALQDGTLLITFNDKTSETVVLSITESDNPFPIASKEFFVNPNIPPNIVRSS